MNYSITKLREISHRISELYQCELEKLPYGANVLDELHANENAHSRILRMLLQYSGGGVFPVYSSFINLLKANCQQFLDNINCYKPEFVNEEGRIDLLIKEYVAKDKFAIIVENKVCGAPDQPEQIQRYIEKVEGDGIPYNRIFVVYLTLNGEKEVSELSLTETAKNKLEITKDSFGRFISLNYRYHILPWLQNDIMNNISEKEETLISSIRLYADYLKGLFGEREGEKEIFNNKIIPKMKEELKINTIKECVEAYSEVSSFHDQLANLLVEEARNVMEEFFYKPMREELKITFENTGVDTCHFWFDIKVSSWKKTKIRFTYDSSGQYYGICLKDINDKVSDSVSDNLINQFGGNKSQWWPWYDMLNKKIETADSLNIWETVENGEFPTMFKEWFNKLMDLCKKGNMEL